jgi:hypothetical protein
MSKTWSKEDRHSFEKSEVMQGLETIVLDTLRRADILQEKFAAQTPEEIDKLTESMGKAKQEAEGLGEALSNFSDDDLEPEDNDPDADLADDEVAEDSLQNEVVDDLRDLVAAAISEGNIKLAYRIERTIDEILEQDTPCI